eukprot:CAMPEP_0185759240 /NCGR_PEP_ID=MMETSP1174-20130828/17959_1 /TAXON_ID=35687 /ORGANISM="Dictyocha speculum, Strain CCMP1381" /LENGTH=184 /DNA_ID=CAMNT_0028439475 /DNA_START=99 /DNA_END=653 /DNA_ORIENTATION=+
MTLAEMNQARNIAVDAHHAWVPPAGDDNTLNQPLMSTPKAEDASACDCLQRTFCTHKTIVVPLLIFLSVASVVLFGLRIGLSCEAALWSEAGLLVQFFVAIFFTRAFIKGYSYLRLTQLFSIICACFSLAVAIRDFIHGGCKKQEHLTAWVGLVIVGGWLICGIVARSTYLNQQKQRNALPPEF